MKYTFFLSIMAIFLGCSTTKGYPADLLGDIVPINTDERFKDMIEQQGSSTNSTVTQKKGTQKK
jgi:hypothetical protein